MGLRRNFIRRYTAPSISVRRAAKIVRRIPRALITDSLIKKRFEYTIRPISELRMGVGHFNELNDSLSFFFFFFSFIYNRTRRWLLFLFNFPNPFVETRERNEKEREKSVEKSEARGGPYTHRYSVWKARQNANPFLSKLNFPFSACFPPPLSLSLSHSALYFLILSVISTFLIFLISFIYLVRLMRVCAIPRRYVTLYKNEGYHNEERRGIKNTKKQPTKSRRAKKKMIHRRTNNKTFSFFEPTERVS